MPRVILRTLNTSLWWWGMTQKSFWVSLLKNLWKYQFPMPIIDCQCFFHLLPVLAKKLMKKEERKKLYFHLTSGLIYQLILFKLLWSSSLKNSIQDWIFLPFTGSKKVLRAQNAFYSKILLKNYLCPAGFKLIECLFSGQNLIYTVLLSNGY